MLNVCVQRNLNISFKSYTLNWEGVYKIVFACTQACGSCWYCCCHHHIPFILNETNRTEANQNVAHAHSFAVLLFLPFFTFRSVSIPLNDSTENSFVRLFPFSLYYNIDWWWYIFLHFVRWPANSQLVEAHDNRIQYWKKDIHDRFFFSP